MTPTARMNLAKAVRKKEKKVCPECGKDIHSADCAYYSKKRE
jgi:hypothetical protein